MEDPGAADRGERPDSLVRPYVSGAGAGTPPPAPGEWFVPPGQIIAPVTDEDPPPEKAEPATTRRRPLAIGAAAAIVVLIGLVLLILPRHSPAVLAVKQAPPQAPVTALPVMTTPAAPSARPSPARRAAAPPADTGEPATAAMTAAPSPSRSAPSRPTTGPPSLTPGSRISIRATTACCTTYYIRHDDGDNRVVITQLTSDSPGGYKADASWIVRAGLADSSCISFESANEPGQYLRHFDFELYLEPDDGSHQFALDATFCPQPGNSGQGTSFESVNYPSMYIRHYDYVVYLAGDGGWNPWDTPVLWPYDSTWAVSQPWG
jgi:hypothetical protein